MEEDIRKAARPHDARPGSLGALIHVAVRRAIEVAVEEELTTALGAARYARDVGRGGYRNGHRPRRVTGPTGPLALTLPRATLFTAMDAQECTSALVPRYQRRLREVNPRNRAFPVLRARAMLTHRNSRHRPNPSIAPSWGGPEAGPRRA